jgi:hypothetical protein
MALLIWPWLPFTVHSAVAFVIQVCWQLSSRIFCWWTEEVSETCRVSFPE